MSKCKCTNDDGAGWAVMADIIDSVPWYIWVLVVILSWVLRP